MFVAASTRCFPDLSLVHCLEKLSDLEYTASEIVMGRSASDLPIDLQLSDLDQAYRACTCCRQIVPAAFFLDTPADDPAFFSRFNVCARLANELRVVPITVRSAPQGTPFNEEIERLRRLVNHGRQNGIVISVLTEGETMAGSADSIVSLCHSIPGLAVTLDPSWFIYKRKKNTDYDSFIQYIAHVRLRDTTETKFQVQIGQGHLEYNKLVVQLAKIRYNRALCVDLAPLPNLDQECEMRKMRLLMESIL